MFYLTKVNKIKYKGVSFFAETFPELNMMFEKLGQMTPSDPAYQKQVKTIEGFLKIKTIKEEIILEYSDYIGDEEFCEVKEFITGQKILVDRDVLLLSRKIDLNEVSRYKSSLIPRNFGTVYKMIGNYTKGIEKAKDPQKSFIYRK